MPFCVAALSGVLFGVWLRVCSTYGYPVAQESVFSYVHARASKF